MRVSVYVLVLTPISIPRKAAIVTVLRTHLAIDNNSRLFHPMIDIITDSAKKVLYV